MLELEGTVQITSLDLLHNIYHLECENQAYHGLPDLKISICCGLHDTARPGVAVKVCSQPMFAEEQVAGKPPVAEPHLQCQGVADSE